ncbi:MAG: nitroreductase family protein [Gammaproteobacteria bacterium]
MAKQRKARNDGDTAVIDAVMDAVTNDVTPTGSCDDASRPQRARRVAPNPGDPFNEVESVIIERRSVRVYRDKPVPEYLVKRILEAGRYAPTAGNCQSWKFVVVQDPQLIAEMAEHVKKMAVYVARYMFNPGAPGSRVPEWMVRVMSRTFTSLYHPTGRTGLSKVADGTLDVWHGASTVIFLLVDERGTSDPHLDVGICGTNMVLTAHSFGLGTCWVSFSTLLSIHPRFRKLLGISYPFRLATSIAVGYPRGIPDGEVPRETHETVWYKADGTRDTFY